MNIIIIILLGVIIYLLLSSDGKVPAVGKLAFGRRKIILDSCTLIDGRIVEVVRTGFVADQLIIPKFILSELQMLADGSDSHKRERARFGLEVAAEIQEYVWANVQVSDINFSGVTATDDKLVKLAKKVHGVLCTTDYNLNKVAAVEGVRTLNINELAQGLRPVTLPGEELQIKIIQRGSSADQGVGYLEDGTMIVVDGAARQIGATIPVVVDRMHQTVAGKMVFAHHKGPVPTSQQSKHLTPNSSGNRLRPKQSQPRPRRTVDDKQSTLAKRLRKI